MKHKYKLTMIREGKTPFQKPRIPASLNKSLTWNRDKQVNQKPEPDNYYQV